MEKKKILKIGFLVLAIILVIVMIVFLVKWVKKSPIRVVEKFIEASEDEDIEKLEKLFDFKGFVAWNECDEKVSKFKDEYKKTEDDDIDDLLEEWGYDDRSDYLESMLYGGADLEIKGEPTSNKKDNGIYKVKAKIKVDDDGYKFTETWEFIIYKNKVIYCTDVD